MDKPISAGDLVMVVKTPHACNEKWLGYTYIVDYIHPLNATCKSCGADLCTGSSTAMVSGRRFEGCPIPWLKRIPPLNELEEESSYVNRYEDIRA
jgi:hypothetical protein